LVDHLLPCILANWNGMPRLLLTVM
jgi:hypothetical protein